MIISLSKDRIKERITAEMLFFIAFIDRLVIAGWASTMFPSVPILNKVALLLFVLAIGIKVVFYDSYSLNEIVAYSVVTALIGLQTVKSGYNIPFTILLLIIGARGVDFKKILQIYITVVGSIVLFATICSLLGVIDNLRYWQENTESYRNSFGILHCTDYSSHMFFLFLAYFYLRNKKLRILEYLYFTLFAALVFMATKGKLDFICMLAMILIFAVGNLTQKEFFGKKFRHFWQIMWKIVGPLSMPLGVAIMFVMTFAYSEDNGFLSSLDNIITNRLMFGQKAINQSGLSLFGKSLEFVGNGGTEVVPSKDEYNFPDCSFVYVMLCYGIVILAVIVFAHILACINQGNDIYLMYAIALVSLNCMISHHLLDISYNPFILCLVATAIPKGIKLNDKSKIQYSLNT